MARKSVPGAEGASPLAAESLPAELAEEARVGSTPAGEAVNAALLALSRAARSFLLYQPNNATIRAFIEEYRAKTRRALDATAALDLEVRPFELAYAGEVVYHEPERERSLAFRLFRDGVRRIRIAREVRWEEMLRLLEVLSIRYAGVRQNEDDIVTLLRKAGFAHIEVSVVEGFVPAEDETDQGQVASSPPRSAPAREVPVDWDLPVRDLQEQAALEWRAVAAEAASALAAEEAEEAFAPNVVLAVKALLELRVGELATPKELGEFVPFVTEARDFLVAEGRLGELVEMVRCIYDAMRTASAVTAPILRAFGERNVLRRLIVVVAPTSMSPPGELIELLDLAPADHLATLIDLLAEDFDEPARRIMRQLIERYAPERPDYLLSRLRDAAPRVACDLLRACARALPERAVDAALELTGHADAAVVHEALRRFEKAPANPRVSRTLAQLLANSHEDVRLRALDLLSRRSEHAAFGAVAEHAERRAAAGVSAREAELIGRTLAHLSPDSALTLFDEWLRPKGLVSRWVEGSGGRMLEWMLVSGLGVLPTAEAETRLRSLAERASDDLRRHVQATLARRRQGKDDSDG
jgi:hypothetical protein